MFDAQCDLAALVYDRDQDPDAVLEAFVDGLKGAGCRAVGLVQLGHHRAGEEHLQARLLHADTAIDLFRDPGTSAAGSRLDAARLLDVGGQMACALEAGADVLIVNRFGRQERAGKGLSSLIERALDMDIPVVIAVPSHRFADWIRFSGGMSVKLACGKHALDAWWASVSGRGSGAFQGGHRSVCEIIK